MSARPVVSREYKAMLLPERFAGHEEALLEHAAKLWRGFSTAIEPFVVGTAGDLSRIKDRRAITFFDTRDRLLNGAHYIFRQRRDLEKDKRDLTLKFRHPDRYVSQDRNMDAAAGPGPRTKFEEDIKPPFVSMYSFSTRLTVAATAPVGTLGDVRRLVPDVAERVAGFRDDRPIVPVNGFTARELVLEGGTLQIGRTPKVEAECALIAWYAAGEAERPVAVEFSFRYGDERGLYGGGAARRAYDVMTALQTMKKWFDPNQQTKTGFVFA